MLKNENSNEAFARYGLFFCLIGSVSQMFLYPNGMYVNFICGCLAIASGIIAKRIEKGTRFSTFDIIFGFIAVIFSFLMFYGTYAIYSALSDPIQGPKFLELFSKMMDEYGITMEDFSRMMR